MHWHSVKRRFVSVSSLAKSKQACWTFSWWLHATETIMLRQLLVTWTIFFNLKPSKLKNMHDLGFDGTNTMLGHRTGVWKRLRFLSPSALYIHCRCHQLQLAAIIADNDHTEVQRVLGILLTIGKAFHYSPKKKQKSQLWYKLSFSHHK